MSLEGGREGREGRGGEGMGGVGREGGREGEGRGSQHSIGSTPHNNGTYYVRRNVDTQTECHVIKVTELESKLVVHSSISLQLFTSLSC